MKSETNAIVTMTPPTIIDISPHPYCPRSSSELAGSGKVCGSPPRSARAVSGARASGAGDPGLGSAGSVAEVVTSFVGGSCAVAGWASNAVHSAASAAPWAILVSCVGERMSMPSPQQAVCQAAVSFDRIRVAPLRGSGLARALEASAIPPRLGNNGAPNRLSEGSERAKLTGRSRRPRAHCDVPALFTCRKRRSVGSRSDLGWRPGSARLSRWGSASAPRQGARVSDIRPPASVGDCGSGKKEAARAGSRYHRARWPAPLRRAPRPLLDYRCSGVGSFHSLRLR